MKIVTISLAALLVSSLMPLDAFAGPKNKHGVPPGLAKKGGLPPGIAKKYAVGQRLPYGAYTLVEVKYRGWLPYNSPGGREWVRVGRDLYLLSAATGTIVDVVHNWLN